MKAQTYKQLKRLQARQQANSDAAQDLAELAPTSGKSVFDAICDASDATRTNPQRAALTATAQASIINKLTGR